MNKILSLGLFVFLLGCGTLDRQEITGIEISPQVKAEQEAELKLAENELQNHNYAKAEELFLQ